MQNSSSLTHSYPIKHCKLLNSLQSQSSFPSQDGADGCSPRTLLLVTESAQTHSAAVGSPQMPRCLPPPLRAETPCCAVGRRGPGRRPDKLCTCYSTCLRDISGSRAISLKLPQGPDSTSDNKHIILQNLFQQVLLISYSLPCVPRELLVNSICPQG